MRLRTKIATLLLALAVAFVGFAPAASANTGPTVDSYEFYKIKNGMTSRQVKDIADTWGSITWQHSGYSGTFMDKEYKSAYSKYGWVDVDYKYYNGAYRVISKSAYWGRSAKWTPTNNKMTKSEFSKITHGMTLDAVRKTADTKGTTTYHYFGTWSSKQKHLDIEWPVDSKYGWADVSFKYWSGAYRVSSKSAYWG
ncbi:hypothetical protein GCM10025865_18160 [Paraoerskovia sediminicola]|uniref:Uncharacterized protein n=1 Tax=Paraoerskovia sediminicola TaxID=1138587 RepID=A0ABN6XC46_9CELL|nr:hypothetical protein [Paraoerskovia sediminicola]BDZ42517.1 hypothetical protein GCM10025865_18160 [Paraoerskovia sediminicola]